MSTLPLLLFTPHHPEAFHIPSNGLLSSPSIITHNNPTYFCCLRCLCLAFLVTKPEHIIPAEDETYFYTEWQNFICITDLSHFDILLFGASLVFQTLGDAENQECFLRKGERCRDILREAGKVMSGSSGVMGVQETLLVHFQMTTRTLEVVGGLCGKMKCFQSRVRIWSFYAEDAKLQKYTESLRVLLNIGKN